VYEWWNYRLRTILWQHSVFSDYNDMADNKAYLVDSSQFWLFGRDKSEGKYNFAIASGNKAGQAVKGFRVLLLFRKMSPLGNATALDCANYTVSMFSDLTKMVTLQNLHDGGFQIWESVRRLWKCLSR
jgi:enoyl-[acyl-carrier protein] reductase I